LLAAQIQYWRVDDPDEVRSTDVITGPPVDPCPPYNVFPEQLLHRRRRSPVLGPVDDLWPYSNIRAGVLVLNHGSAGKLSDTIDFNTPEAGLFIYLFVYLFIYYIRQVNGVKLTDILFSLLSVCLSVSTLCALSPVFNSMCPFHNASAISLMQPMSIPKPISL